MPIRTVEEEFRTQKHLAAARNSMQYPGGKGGAGVYQKIINLMPPHRVYIEPFLGGAAVMRRKRPAELNYGIDLDPAPVALASAAPGFLSDVSSYFRFQNADGIRFLQRYRWFGHELVYCDPPYLMELRSRKRRLYRCEMADVDHLRLLRVVMDLPCMVMLSGYWSEIYAATLKNWNSIHFDAMTRGGRPATEWVWFNFAKPSELHDPRYLGENFRARERINRQKRRWVARLRGMPALQRQALLAAIAHLDVSIDGGLPRRK